MADITREEQYLSAIANGSTDVPEPVTREEQYLYQIAVNGGGGGGASSADKVSYDNTTSGLSATNVQAAIDEVSQGGGGGGESTVEAIEFVMTESGFETSLTSGEIKTLVQAGKALIGVMYAMDAYTQFMVGLSTFSVSGNVLMVIGLGQDDPPTAQVFTFTAETDSDVFSLSF